VETICCTPSTTKTPEPIVTAWIVIRTDDASHSENARWLRPAEQCSRTRWEIWGRYA
jgi:hypothetical protein